MVTAWSRYTEQHGHHGLSNDSMVTSSAHVNSELHGVKHSLELVQSQRRSRGLRGQLPPNRAQQKGPCAPLGKGLRPLVGALGPLLMT